MVSLKERLELSSLSKREDKVRAKIKSLKRRIADAESYYGSLVELAEKNPYSREDRLDEARKAKKDVERNKDLLTLYEAELESITDKLQNSSESQPGME